MPEGKAHKVKIGKDAVTKSIGSFNRWLERMSLSKRTEVSPYQLGDSIDRMKEQDEWNKQMLAREARMVQEFNQAGVKGVPEFDGLIGDVNSEKTCFSMKRIEAKPLIGLGPIKPRKVVGYTKQAGRILEEASMAVGLLSHGDVKPENILVSDDDQVFVVDFHTARLKGEGKTLLGYTDNFVSLITLAKDLDNYDPLDTDVPSLVKTMIEWMIGRKNYDKLISQLNINQFKEHGIGRFVQQHNRFLVQELKREQAFRFGMEIIPEDLRGLFAEVLGKDMRASFNKDEVNEVVGWNEFFEKLDSVTT